MGALHPQVCLGLYSHTHVDTRKFACDNARLWLFLTWVWAHTLCKCCAGCALLRYSWWCAQMLRWM